jgi:hypothetical protein
MLKGSDEYHRRSVATSAKQTVKEIPGTEVLKAISPKPRSFMAYRRIVCSL